MSNSLQEIEDQGAGIEKRRERQRLEARQSIIDATEALLIESNEADFSIRRLGERCGYSAPTVYHHFGDKDGLIDALLEARMAHLAAELEAVPSSGDWLKDLRGILLAYIGFSAENPTFLRLMWTLSRKGESRNPAAMDRVRDCIRNPIEKLAAVGSIEERAERQELAGQMIWALVHGLVSLQLAEPERVQAPDLAARALDTLFLGMSRLDGMSDFQ